MTRAVGERNRRSEGSSTPTLIYTASSIPVVESPPAPVDVDSEIQGLLLRIMVAMGSDTAVLLLVGDDLTNGKLIAAPMGRDEVTISKFMASPISIAVWRDLNRVQPLSVLKSEAVLPHLPAELKSLLFDQPVTSGLVVSLRGEEQCLGAVFAGWKHERKFTQRDLQHFEEIASQTALTVELGMLREKMHQVGLALSEKADELKTVAAQAQAATAERDRVLRYSDIVHSVVTMSLRSMETKQGLQELMARLTGWMGADTGGIWLMDEKTGEVSPEAVVGLESAAGAWSAVDPKAMINGGLLKEGEPVVVENVDQLTALLGKRSRKRAKSGVGVTSLLAMPLSIGGRICGLLGVAWCERHVFSSLDPALIRVVADRLSIGVESRILSNKVQFFNEELQSSLRDLDEMVKYLDALEAISEVGLSQRGTDEMLSELIKRFVDKLGSDLGLIWMLDEERVKLVPKASFSTEQVDFSGFVVEVGWGIGDKLVTAAQTVAVENVSESPELQGVLDNAMPGLTLRSMLAAPLKIQERVIGVVGVFWTRSHKFDAEGIKLLEVTADRAATAIEARRLNEHLQMSNEMLLKSNEELRRTSEELTKANRAKTEFFNTMSHELRTPMNAIAGYTSLMLRERYGPVTPKQTHALQRIEENSKHLLILINSILDLARMEAGRMPINYEEVQLKEIISESVAVIEPITREAKVDLVVSVQDNIPVLWTDRGKLKQILLNFLSNAAKFTHEGSIEVFAQRVSGNGHVKIGVKDTGIGIKEEDLRTLFEPYAQLDNTTNRERAGTGLGLSICKKFANLLGGDIEVQSAYGHGSTFSIIIPCITPKDAPPDPVAVFASGASSCGAGSN